MNWHQSLLKKTFNAIGITLGLTIATTSSVSAASLFWDLELFDESGTQVGDGEFSYDPETTDTISFNNAGNPLGTEVTVNTLLDSLSFNVLGEEITFDTTRKWWEVNSDDAMKEILSVRNFGPDIVSEWESGRFPISIYGADAFTLSGSSTATTGEGTWSFLGNSSIVGIGLTGFPENLRGVEINGTWNAVLREDSSNGVPDNSTTTTPESSSIIALLALSGLALITVRKKF